MAGDFHDVVQINSSQIHECGSGAAGRMAVDQLVFLNLLLLGRAAFGGLNLYQFREAGFFSNLLDVTVNNLSFASS